MHQSGISLYHFYSHIKQKSTEKPYYQTINYMKKFLIIATAVVAAFHSWGASGTQSDPIPLPDGNITVDFGGESSKFYSFSPATDQMLTFSDINNVFIYGSQILPEKEFYIETFKGTTYVQTKAGIDYTIEVVKGFSPNGSSSFTTGHYDCAFPDGDNWEKAIVPFERFTYVPITGDLPAYLRYTAPKDGLLEMRFNIYIGLSYSESQNGTFKDVKTSYEDSGYCGTMNVEAGKTYYFKLTAYSSPLCRFDLIELKEGQSPYLPYILKNGSTGIFPKEVGKYYYQITNDQTASMLQITGNDAFNGSAQFGDSFSNFKAESKNCINLREEVSEYSTQYYLVLTRNTAAETDQEFDVKFSSESYDLFPGQNISEGKTTLPDAPGKFYYTFTVPTDGHNIININAVAQEPSATKSTASLYYSDNKYSSLANGNSIRYTAVAGRKYTVVWNVAADDAPLEFNLEFLAPALGETPDNPLPAQTGENSASGGSAVYFRYNATVDGWLVVKPAAGLKAPSISMLPTETDPYMQACDIINDGDGSYRVASQKDRGYLIIFNSTEEIRFTISELTALPGEAASNPITINSETTDIPSAAAIYWYSYTAARDGKLVISTNIPFQQSVDHQDYTYVQIYSPTDPDNRIAQLRPDYDLGTFDEKIIDTTAGSKYLIKVRTLVAADNQWIKCIVRDPIAGEIAELPIEIPFNGVSGQYEFNRMVNYEADAIWYGITLPTGYFTLKGISGGAFNLSLFTADNTDKPLAQTEVLDLDYDEDNEMYIYLWGIAGYHITAPGKYLLKLSDNEVPFTATIDMSTTGISDVTSDNGISVSPVSGGIILTSDATTEARIYTIDGRLINSVTFAGDITVNLAAGLYIIHSGEKVVKIAVK